MRGEGKPGGGKMPAQRIRQRGALGMPARAIAAAQATIRFPGGRQLSARPRRTSGPPVWIPLFLLLTGTLIFRATDADLAIAETFYAGAPAGWTLSDDQPWKALYEYGCFPAMVVGIFGLLAAAASLVVPAIVPLRKPGLFLGLALIIGPGLLVNTVFKPNWGRPRPNQTTAFGGEHEFVFVCGMGSDQKCKSFPCGHASMGFFFMVPAFFFFPKRPRAGFAVLLMGLGYGGLVGLARIVQGRHFASDVLWAAAMVYFSGLVLYYVMRIGTIADSAAGPVAERDANQETIKLHRLGPAVVPQEEAEPGYRKAA